MSSHASQLTFIGLGNMGAALASAQLQARTSITVWNRTRAKAEVDRLIDAGAMFEADLAEAIVASPITILCVLDYGTLYQILKPLSAAPSKEGPLDGKTIINFTNGTPKDARAMSEWMAARGVTTYLDGGIMASPDTVGTEEAFVFYSGANQAAFDDLKATMAVFGRPEYHGLDPGAAALLDLSLLAGMYGMLQGSMIAISLLRRQKPKDADRKNVGEGEAGAFERQVKTLLNPLLQSFMSANVRMARAIDHGDVGAHGHPMEMQTVAMQNVSRACEEEGIDGSVFKPFFGMVQNRVEQGGGKDGIAALLDELAQQNV